MGWKEVDAAQRVEILHSSLYHSKREETFRHVSPERFFSSYPEMYRPITTVDCSENTVVVAAVAVAFEDTVDIVHLADMDTDRSSQADGATGSALSE